jgi:twitching motility protein PilU
MINQGFVRELILKGEIAKIKDVMEQNNSIGMCSYDQSLLALFREGHISEDVVIANADKPSDMKVKLQQVKLSAQMGALDQADKKDVLSALDTSRIFFSE